MKTANVIFEIFFWPRKGIILCFEARLQMERVTEKICQRHDKIVKILTPHHLFFPKMRNDEEERRYHSHHCHHLSWSEVE